MTQTATRTARGARTRQRIVAAAAELVHAHGLAATTNEQVRTAAAVSGSQLGHYFADKDALVAAVLDHQDERVLGHEQIAWAGLDEIAGLRAWRDRVVASQQVGSCRGGCPIGSLGAALAESDEESRHRVAHVLDRWRLIIEGGLASLREHGGLPADVDIPRLAGAVLASLQGGLLLSQVARDVRPLADALDAVIDHVEALGTAGRSPGAPSAAAGRRR